MSNKVHVLNGDALYDRFPEDITGQRIICREALIEGPVTAKNLSQFFDQRAKYLTRYTDDSEYYHSHVLPQFQSMLKLGVNDEVYLWFEQDVFCQLNCGFVIYLITEYTDCRNIYLVVPEGESKYSFSRLDDSGLSSAFAKAKKTKRRQLEVYSELWMSYRDDDMEYLEKTAGWIKDFSWITDATKAIIAMKEGELKKLVKEIVTEVGSKELKDIFPVFQKRAAIYGMGDLQVKQLIDKA